jgi:hypothetical protein
VCLRPGLILWYNLGNGKGDMRFVTWNVRGVYWSGFLTTVASELSRYKLDFVGVQEVRLDKGAL